MERVNRILGHEAYRTSLARLTALEQQRRFCRHDMEHFLSVARIMLLLSASKANTPEVELIYATALLHDIGRVEEYERGEAHPEVGARLAEQILPDCGYSPADTERIRQAIRTHKAANESTDVLARLLQEADHLSRNCFCCPTQSECYWPEARRNKGVTL